MSALIPKAHVSWKYFASIFSVAQECKESPSTEPISTITKSGIERKPSQTSLYGFIAKVPTWIEPVNRIALDIAPSVECLRKPITSRPWILVEEPPCLGLIVPGPEEEELGISLPPLPGEISCAAADLMRAAELALLMY